MGSKVVTMLSTANNLDKVMTYADIVITCAQTIGRKAPIILTDDHIKSMKERAVLIDLAIDGGGNSITSRPTNHASPTYVKYNVIHYCVPNISSIVARSASYAMNNALIPYLTKLLEAKDFNVVERIKLDPFWSTGIVFLQGEPVHESMKTRLNQSVPYSNN